ncbi:Spx/MgsR family transcriptional regulator [Aliiruegeria haliotis]|uniref:Spx/MgsR family transcriptional regulator n=1 Tax=Aliiruegeria haliotis TaxID=1280846 RepID=A0A2T0RUW0_9RHOB|nr:ArsC/Spx/MgsR family protein [Aliiruegeria haliotis]PRY24937.1 Spx/MgsR family transcriptional regulator [Aliiruegeria haliotis]
MILYGIPTCDTCRKARKALEAAGHDVTFRDIRKEPLHEADWVSLLEQFGDTLLNRRSTTWKGLSDSDRAGDPAALLRAHPTLMKRPVIEAKGKRTLGWDAAAKATWGCEA